MTWDEALVLWALDMLPADFLPDAAALALQQGLDGRLTRDLAGASPMSAGLRERFADVLDELAVDVPPRADAARFLAVKVSSEILTGTLDPFEGARRLGLVSRVAGPTFRDFDAFIYAESEAEDRPSDREFFAEAIIEEARKWVNRNSQPIDRRSSR